MPGPGGGTLALGTLLDVDGRAPLFQLQAGLAAGRELCDVCQEGLIVGTLSDGVGPDADLRAEGIYLGAVFFGVGAGAFLVELRTLDGEKVGEMKGVYLDPAALDGALVGYFAAHYELES